MYLFFIPGEFRNLYLRQGGKLNIGKFLERDIGKAKITGEARSRLFLSHFGVLTILKVGRCDDWRRVNFVS